MAKPSDSSRNFCFVVTKPLQVLIALSIIRQSGLADQSHFVIVDNFADASLVHQRMQNIDWDFSALSLHFCADLIDAFAFVRAQQPQILFIDSDVGVRKYLMLRRLRRDVRGLSIHVYEEGIGTYRTDLYTGARKHLLSAFGIGVHFGGSRLTEAIHLCDPAAYVRAFPHMAHKAIAIETSPSALVRQYRPQMTQIFNPEGQVRPGSSHCNVYLTGWQIDHAFVHNLADSGADLLIKPHPHIKDRPAFDRARILPNGAPAEIILMDLAESYASVCVYHHGTSAERYVEHERIRFQRISHGD